MLDDAESIRGLVVRLGALGDTLLFEPALAALRQLRPKLSWELLGTFPYTQLVQHHLVRLHDAGAARFAPLFAAPPLNQELKLFLTHFRRAAVFSLNPDLQRHLAEHVPQTLCAAPLPAADDPRSVVDYLIDCLEPWTGGRAGARRFPLVAAPPTGGPWSGRVVIAPGAGAAAKRWPLEHWRELARCIDERLPAVRWALLIGPAEASLRHQLDRLAQQIDAELWDSPTLTALSERLAAAQLFIGNDSGPTHLAAAVGCPTLALFGPSSHPRWEPRGARVVTLHVSGAGQWAAPARALRAALQLWAGA